MIPLYGFLRGDTLGVVVLANEEETVESVARKLQSAASVRVAPLAFVRAFHDGHELDLESTVNAAKLRPLDRLDVEQMTTKGGG